MASAAYIAAATNRHSHAADVSTSSTVAFASSSLVALWDLSDNHGRGISLTLPGHDGLVTCVRFVSDVLLVSADDTGVLRRWKRVEAQWMPCGLNQAHSKAISALCVQEKDLATGASDSLVKIWRVAEDADEEALQELQSIDLQGRYPLSLAFARLPGSEADILAVSGTDSNVRVFTRASGSEKFIRAAVLPGHEDWIRSLAFRPPVTGEDTLTLASGSQDATIRLWRIEATEKDRSIQQGSNNKLGDDLLDAFEASLGDLTDAEEGGRQISLKRHAFAVKNRDNGTQQFSIIFDALLVGHEAGITSLKWRPGTSSSSPMPTLLSTSTDSSLIMWSPSTVLASPSSQDGGTILWINRQRFGDIGGQRLGGFVGGLWASEGSEALAWGWSGGWRRWRCLGIGDVHEKWSEVGAVSGHNGSVKGLDWSQGGEYLISAGLDQTTRIHGVIPFGDELKASWHELGRPQVHGYDLLGVTFVNALKFVSIADEKVARVFEAPRNFIDTVEALGIARFSAQEHDRPVGASVPPLGLSNKAVGEVIDFTSTYTTAPDRRLFEGELAATTLWPETEKVFGHGYESITLAISPSRKLIATACKATSPEHAVVRVYDTEKWQPVGAPLGGHSLTVTGVAFSPDDRLVLTASRDRSWRLFELRDEGYVAVAADKSHGRIIWGCAWAHEGDVFATASRDKTVKVWQQTSPADVSKWTALSTIKTKEAATAVDFAPADAPGRRRLAIGLETGEILIYGNVHSAPTQWELDLLIDAQTAHVGHIYRLAWRPASPTQIASCSEDGTLRVIDIPLKF